MKTTNVDSTGITAKSGVVVSGGDLKVGSAFTVGQAGVVTATQFVGDGSELTGVISGVELKSEGNQSAQQSLRSTLSDSTQSPHQLRSFHSDQLGSL